VRQESHKELTPTVRRHRRTYRDAVGRPLREFVPWAIYHVYSRGSNRQAIFAFDSDRVDFLDCLGRVVRKHELRCFAYCLMPNHYHLILQTPDGRLSEAMKALNGRYALRFNHRYGRDAHLFKNRFGAVLQESDAQLFQAIRYTVRNPVDSGLCAQAGEWPWSSYRPSVSLGDGPEFLDVMGLLSFFGDEARSATARLRRLVEEPLGV
jgi:REP element-mobilizing transposase RayT